MDERLTNIEAQKQAQLNKNEQIYSGLLTDAQNLYNQQQNYANQYETTQNDILDKQLAYNTGLIEQQKEIARQNKAEEERKARNSYDAYQNQYGNNAERLASSGLNNSGYMLRQSDSANAAYQNRLAAANKTLQNAITQYDNDINAARLNNDVSKAQNALEKLKLQLQYSESYYNKKGDLTINQFNTGRDIDTDYYNRYQTEYSNIQNEKAREEAIRQWEAEMAEKQRQYNENMAYQKERDRVADEQWAKEYALSQAAAAAKRTSGGGSYNLTNGSGGNELSNGSGYSILSVDENGWGKTNLTQSLPGGGSAEVYRNPQGELLYWNPSTNGWMSYGTTSNSNNNSGRSSGYLKSTYTPNLSSQNATSWLSQNIKPKMTTEDLARVISNGESQGILKSGDREKIYKSYGL